MTNDLQPRKLKEDLDEWSLKLVKKVCKCKPKLKKKPNELVKVLNESEERCFYVPETHEFSSGSCFGSGRIGRHLS